MDHYVTNVITISILQMRKNVYKYAHQVNKDLETMDSASNSALRDIYLIIPALSMVKEYQIIIVTIEINVELVNLI